MYVSLLQSPIKTANVINKYQNQFLFLSNAFVPTGIAEVGLLELKYDTRNIGDLASFSKAWSQTKLIEKLLLKPDDSSGTAVEAEAVPETKADGKGLKVKCI